MSVTPTAQVRYRGDHPEPSFAFPRLDAPTPVLPFGTLDPEQGYHSRRIESICLPRGVWRAVNPFAAVYLAAIRRRHGPWFDVRLTPAVWREVQRRASWIRTAKWGQLALGTSPSAAFEVWPTDAVRLCDAEVTDRLYQMCLRTYRVLA